MNHVFISLSNCFFVKAKSLLVPSLAAAVGYTVAPGEPVIDHIPASRGSRCRIARQDAAGRVVVGGGGGAEGRETKPASAPSP